MREELQPQLRHRVVTPGCLVHLVLLQLKQPKAAVPGLLIHWLAASVTLLFMCRSVATASGALACTDVVSAWQALAQVPCAFHVHLASVQVKHPGQLYQVP